MELRKSNVQKLLDSFSLIPFPEEDGFVFIDKEFYQIPPPNSSQKKQPASQQVPKSSLLNSEFKLQSSILPQSNSTEFKVENGIVSIIKKNLKEGGGEEEVDDFIEINRERSSSSCQNTYVLMPKIEFNENFLVHISSEEWMSLLERRRFNFQEDPILFERIKLTVYRGLPDAERPVREAAWLLLLGINLNDPEFIAHQELYYELIKSKGSNEMTKSQFPVENQILKDVYRTFASLGKFNQDPATGKNKLYNILKAYSIINYDVKYMQGMNFIAATILMIIEDESVAYYVFSKFLDKDKWRQLYLADTPKLYSLTDQLRDFVKKELPQLQKQFVKFDIYLESIFASAFMTIFSNLVSMEIALKIFDRFVLDGEKSVMDILKNMLKSKESHLIKMELWDIQVYLGKRIYEICLDDNTFFPAYQQKQSQQI